jgi:fatty-acyl-CoA synthase
MATVVDLLSNPGDATLTIVGLAGDTRLSWVQVHERARAMAQALTVLGVEPGCRVGLLGDTSAGLVTAIQAVWLRGAAFTVLPLPALKTGAAGTAYLEHLSAVVADSRLSLLIVDDQLAAQGAALSPLVKCQALSGLDTKRRTGEVVKPGPNDLAFLQYTSGSTRSPRGVPVTHANLAANLASISEAVGSDLVDPATACPLSWLPLHHDMGLVGFLALPMSRGCRLVLQSPAAFAIRPASWFAGISQHRATVTGGPNFAFALMAQLLEAGGFDGDLSTVRYMITGGEPVDAAMMARFTTAAGRHGLDPGALIAAYGLAEATLAVSFSPAGSGITTDEVDPEELDRNGLARRRHAGARGRTLVRLGRAVPGTRIRIVKDGRMAAPGEVGQIDVSGASVVAGYWGEAPRRSPWLRTGDLGYRTADGDELVVCGRAKDVLFAAGRNIYPQDVEAAAGAVPGVRPGGVAAFGVAGEHGGYGDRLVVAVETRLTTYAERRTLASAVHATVAGQASLAPADVVMLRPGGLPKTTSGKPRRAETRRRYLAGELTEPATNQGLSDDRSAGDHTSRARRTA